jgi:hypothetical protein
MIELLEQLYGPLKDSTRIEFEDIDIKSKDIAKQIGADTAYVSRILNPTVDKPNTKVSIQRFNHRLSILLDLRDKEERIKELETKKTAQPVGNGLFSYPLQSALPFIAILLAATIGITHWLTRNATKDKAAVTETKTVLVHDPILSREESRDIFDIYGKHIQYRMAIEALRFHEMYKTGRYDNQLDYQTQELATRINIILEEGRRTMRGTNIRYQDGTLLGDLYEQYSDNNIDGNITQLMPLLTNEEAYYEDIIHAVTERVESEQIENERAWEGNTRADNKSCCFVLSTEEQVDNFLEITADLSGYEMLYQGLLLKAVMDNLSKKNQENQYRIAQERMVDIVVETIKKNRNRIRNMGYLSVKGRNVVDIIDELQPMEINRKYAKEVVPFIIDPTITLPEIEELFLSKIAEVHSNGFDKIKQAILAN